MPQKQVSNAAPLDEPLGNRQGQKFPKSVKKFPKVPISSQQTTDVASSFSQILFREKNIRNLERIEKGLFGPLKRPMLLTQIHKRASRSNIDEKVCNGLF